MQPPQRPPNPSLPPHLADPQAFAELRERVRNKYGAFGEREVEVPAVARNAELLKDVWIGPAVKIASSVWVASFAASFLGKLATLLTAIVWVPLLVWVMRKKPVALSARVFLLLALVLENPGETPRLYWDSPLDPAAFALFAGIKDWSNLPGASVPVYTLLAGWLAYRASRKRFMRREGYPEPPRIVLRAVGWYAAGLFVYWGYGVFSGGDLSPSFFQLLQLLTVPLLVLAFLYAFRVPDDLPAIGGIVVVAAVMRSLLCAFVYFVICRARGIWPEYCTTHSDSVLYVTAVVLLALHALEQRKRAVVLKCLGLALVILAAIVWNNRRLAFVALALGPLLVYFTLEASPVRRKINRVITIMGPLLAVYLAVGTSVESDATIFKPARLVLSVVEQKDDSSASRDDENFNLIHTFKQHPVVGTGFGWQYEEQVKRYDIEDFLKFYRYLPHNGVLWLWSLGGVVGFVWLWSVFPLGAAYAIRAYRVADLPVVRTAALTALAANAASVAQFWGDQGYLSFLGLTFFALAFALSGRIAGVKPPVFGGAGGLVRPR